MIKYLQQENNNRENNTHEATSFADDEKWKRIVNASFARKFAGSNAIILIKNFEIYYIKNKIKKCFFFLRNDATFI